MHDGPNPLRETEEQINEDDTRAHPDGTRPDDGGVRGCPHLPALEIEPSEAAVETAMDLAYALSQSVVDAGLADVPSDSLTIGPTDSIQPNDRRPDARRRDDRRPDARRPDDRRPDRGRAELAVALSGQAVALATRLLHEQGADEEQERLLMHAEEQYRKAKAALEEGREALAAEPGA